MTLMVLSSTLVLLKMLNPFLIQLTAGTGEPSKEQVSDRDSGVLTMVDSKLVTTSGATR